MTALTVPATPSETARVFLDGIRVPVVFSVHSRFSRALNLQHTDGRLLLTVSDASLGGAPLGIVASMPPGVALNKEATGASASFDGARLALGPVVLEVSRGPGYRVTFPVPEGKAWWSPARLESELAAAARAGHDKAPGLGAFPARAEESRPARLWEDRLGEVTARLAGGNAPTAFEAALGLLGLGPGLTPSGDDLLVGFLAATGTPWSADGSRELLQRANTATTLISYNYILHALERRFSTLVGALLGALWTGPDEAVRENLRALLRAGATSGRDTIRGLVAGLRRREHAGG